MTAPRLRLRDSTRSRRRAFTTLEMVGVLILLSAFALTASRLFTSSFKLTYNAANAHDKVASAEIAVAALRWDVSTAKEIKVTGGTTAKLAQPDGRVITWSIQDDQLFRREDDAEDRWRAPSAITTFSTDGVTLVLKNDDPRTSAGFGEVWMSSQSKVIAKLTMP